MRDLAGARREWPSRWHVSSDPGSRWTPLSLAHTKCSGCGLRDTDRRFVKSELGRSTTSKVSYSRVRSLARVIGKSQVHGLDGDGYDKLSERICAEIGKIVDARLPKQASCLCRSCELVTGATRQHPVEIFTTNYDLLLEEGFEAVRAPYFDGFTGGREPFFDPVSIANNDLPARWTRLWKLHGSPGWCKGERRSHPLREEGSATHLVFPSISNTIKPRRRHIRRFLIGLRRFLSTDDALLISIGFSFVDAHVAARISDRSRIQSLGRVSSLFNSKFWRRRRRRASSLPACRTSASTARDKAIMNGVARALVTTYGPTGAKTGDLSEPRIGGNPNPRRSATVLVRSHRNLRLGSLLHRDQLRSRAWSGPTPTAPVL